MLWDRLRSRPVITGTIVTSGVLLTTALSGCPTGQICGQCGVCGALLPITGIATYLWALGTKKKKTMRKYKALILGILAFAVAVFAGRWGKALFTTSEFVHFSVNFPTDGIAQTLPVEDLGGPWARLEESEWNGYPAGGILVWGTEGKITVDLGRQGWIKELVQPRSVLLSTHWLRNVGTRPYQVSLELHMCGFETKWITFEKHWDQDRKTFTRTVLPKAMLNMDWEVTVPEERLTDATICTGALIVRDATNSDILTRLPIELVNSRGGDG